MVARSVLDWLLEADQPAIRYRTLTELLGRPRNDPEIRGAAQEIPRKGWVAEILGERQAGGWWVHDENLYAPKYLATNWRLIVLSDLGVTRAHPAVRASCEYWMRRMALRGGGVGGNSKGRGHHCVVGNMTRALLRLGYVDDPRIPPSLDWLVGTADPKGGWSCFGLGRTLDSWEGLSAFAAYPRERWTPAMTECVERAAQFYLERELHRQGDRYPPWFRLHYPVHYYYDLLVGLETLTGLGYGRDPRLRYALAWLRNKRRRDGRWNLEAVHPDVQGPVAAWFRAHPKQRPFPWALERVGRPSKMVTLRALLVLGRVGGEVSGGAA
ncbi:MAG TPA: hypothetical protein VGV89_08380 [Thermoplasmata archaeon]|nr:hypothetical protein [Thermoplasmata archaeon]